MSTVDSATRHKTIAPFRISDELVTSNIAGTLMIKLCGFVEDQRAQIIDVSEAQLKLRIGYTLFERFWHGISGHGPLQITLDICDGAEESLPEWQQAQARHSTVHVRVEPTGRNWRQDRFEEAANHVLHRLRLYLMTA